jgi:hypothetical protein
MKGQGAINRDILNKEGNGFMIRYNGGKNIGFQSGVKAKKTTMNNEAI